MDVAILYPVFVQVALTFGLQIWMGLERFKSVRSQTVQRGAHAGLKPIWPERAGVVSNAFQNQLEIPMLFYAAVAFSMITSAVDALMVSLAWAFVITRLVHAFVHTTYNFVPHRFIVYLAGSLIVLAMWVRLFLHVSAGA
ncbi:MAG: MAPEG family protein [Hyphomicrobiaceae bacterium]|nr:MAPEG family protein [Hyphomicrobiaceae bacterium]